jgi:hypothetical protein
VAPGPGLLAAGVAGLVLAAGLTGCGRRTSQTEAAAPRTVAAPLAISTEAAGGTWATLPMGRPGDPLNTFWQLFYRPAGSSSWSDQVDATATATNGGLVLARAGGRSLVVGVRPSDLLHFSPLIATSDGGRTWTNGLTSGLLARPSALAAEQTGQALALVATGTTTTLQATTTLHDTTTPQAAAPGYLATWRTLTSLGDLAGTAAARSCDPDALDAVGYAPTRPVVGARCAEPGVVGLFVQRSGGWQLGGAVLPRSLAGARLDVLSLQPTSGGLAAVLAASGPSGSSLLAAWTRDGGLNWAVSPALQLPADQQLTSMGPAEGDGLFVLMSSSSGSEQLDLVDGPGASWHSLPTPPAGAATVAFGAAGDATGPGTAQALVADGTVLTVWTLGTASSGWAKGQAIHVPIQFGSSS